MIAFTKKDLHQKFIIGVLQRYFKKYWLKHTLSHWTGAVTLFLLQHVCKTKPLQVSVWIKNRQLQLFGSKCFNRISKLQVLHSIGKRGNRYKVFYRKPVLKNSRMTVQYEKSATRKKFNMKTWRKFSVKRVQQKKQHVNSATRKNSNMKRVQHGKNAIWKECNKKKVQDQKSTT